MAPPPQPAGWSACSPAIRAWGSSGTWTPVIPEAIAAARRGGIKIRCPEICNWLRSKRYLWFMVSILVGLALGVIYGWVINPVQYVDTPPSNLRADYKPIMP